MRIGCLLAKAKMVIMGSCSFTFPEEDLHGLGHINSQEGVKITNHSSCSSKEGCFCNRIFGQEPFPEGLSS